MFPYMWGHDLKENIARTLQTSSPAAHGKRHLSIQPTCKMKTINAVINQLKQEGMLPSGPPYSLQTNSSAQETNLSPTLMKIKNKYPTVKEFLVAINPDRQLQICNDPEDCYFGNSPTLISLNKLYGQGAAEVWLAAEVQEACLFMGIKEMPDINQTEKLVKIIALQYGYLKVDELQLFFFNFCSAKYRHFYSTFDPSIIILSLRDFLSDRSRAYEKREQRERDREREEWKKNAITYEEYQRRKKEMGQWNTRCKIGVAESLLLGPRFFKENRQKRIVFYKNS